MVALRILIIYPDKIPLKPLNKSNFLTGTKVNSMALNRRMPRPCSRRRMDIYYLIDTSESMRDNGCIEAVNAVMPEIVGILSDVSKANYDYSDIYMSAVTYNSTAQTLFDVPLPARDFKWLPQTTSGGSDLGAAFRLIRKQLENVAPSASGMLKPAIILLSNGNTDTEWEYELNLLKRIPLFNQAYKIAIAVGPASPKDSMLRPLRMFARAGGIDKSIPVLSVNDLSVLDKVIRIVSATVSNIGSQSRSTVHLSVEHQIKNALIQGFKTENGIYFEPIGLDDSDVY